MYSVVLMMAMTTGGDVTIDRHRGCGSSCNSSCGSSCSSCSSCGYNGNGSSCGYNNYCSTCNSGYYPGAYSGAAPGYCPTCPGGVCPLTAQAPAAGPATIVVSLPADARLTIDDEATASTSDRRVFVTPSLPTGKDYHYTLKAEVTVDGKASVVSKVVTVRAGEATSVSLEAPSGVASR